MTPARMGLVVLVITFAALIVALLLAPVLRAPAYPPTGTLPWLT